MTHTLSIPSPRILVVGAGPAGLTLALSLLENGIPVRIIDKELTHRVGAKGSGIMPRSQEVFNFLGLWPDIQQQAVRFPPMRLYAPPAGTEPVKTWHMAEHIDPTPATPFVRDVYVIQCPMDLPLIPLGQSNPLMLGQDHLEAIMRKHLEQRYGVHVELGTELVSFEQNDAHVSAVLQKRSAGTEEGTEEVVQVSYLVGTDGGRSGVRKRLGLSFLGETREENWLIIADVEVEGLDRDHWHAWGAGFGAKFVSIRPPEKADAGTWAYIGTVAGMTEAEVKDIGSNKTRAEQYFRQVSGRDDVRFGEWAYLTAYRPNIRMVDEFQKGRIFIAGDAGHTHSPAGGQGLNSSVQDSFNLAWKLALVLKELSPPSLLRSYTAERLPVIAEMLQLTTKLLDHTTSLPANTVPDTSDENSGWRRGPALFQLGVNYRWSNIVVDERSAKPGVADGAYGSAGAAHTGPVRAGDRAPNAPDLAVLAGGQSMGTTTTLFDEFRPTAHTALIFIPDALNSVEVIQPLLNVISAHPTGIVRTIAVLASVAAKQPLPSGVDLVVVDQEGHARIGYSMKDGDGVVCVIVRPDGVVGGILLSVEGLKQYFTGIFPSA